MFNLLLITKVLRFLEESAGKGKTFLFVGTKKQAAPLIAKTALHSNSYYVNQRWLGGMFTNWRTIQKSFANYKNIVKLKHVVIEFIKKTRSTRKHREQQRLEKYLGGLENMTNFQGLLSLLVNQKKFML